MSHRTCSVDGCTRKHQARGLCGSHYGTWYKRNRADAYRRSYESEMVERTCTVCSSTWRTTRRDAKYCSELCYHFDKWGPRFSAWPKPAPRAAKPRPIPFHQERECSWCGDTFTTTRPSQTYCSRLHKTKAARNRRRGQEYGSTTHFTWAEVMRVFRKFDRRCAYCEQDIDGMPDPDHVVPLSRGGSNSITNILPCCSPCNSDKRDLLLTEWNADRERRGLPLRTTAWGSADARIFHLTSLQCEGVGRGPKAA